MEPKKLKFQKKEEKAIVTYKYSKKDVQFTIDLKGKFGLLKFANVSSVPEIYVDEKQELIVKYAKSIEDGLWIIIEKNKKDEEFICGMQSEQTGMIIYKIQLMIRKDSIGFI